MPNRRVFEPIDDLSRLGAGIDMRDDDAERAIVEGASRSEYSPFGTRADRRDAGVERGGRDLGEPAT